MGPLLSTAFWAGLKQVPGSPSSPYDVSRPHLAWELEEAASCQGLARRTLSQGVYCLGPNPQGPLALSS